MKMKKQIKNSITVTPFGIALVEEIAEEGACQRNDIPENGD